MNGERTAIAVAQRLVREARASLAAAPFVSDDLAAQAWHALERAGRGVDRSPALVAAWVALARFILHELAPVAIAHGPHIADEQTRFEWYRDTGALVRSALEGRRQLRARGHLRPGEFDEMNADEERAFLAGFDVMTSAAVA